VTQATALFLDLIRVETRLYNAAEARLRAVHDLTLGQFQLLDLIQRVPDCRVQDVVQDIAITVGAASKAVDRLESAGLCRRSANPDDRRSSILTLTEEGARKLKEARPTLEQELIALASEVAGLEEMLKAGGVLAALRESLQKRG
jgi:DNA-binding MarR family transcriptional regulator